ncbi:hypothetical protein ACF0H5_019151 [Mactra antiquata]
MTTKVTHDLTTDSWIENTTDAETSANVQLTRIFVASEEPTISTIKVTTNVTFSSTTSLLHLTTSSHGPIDDFAYTGFHFEQPVYLYVWEILTIIVCIVNILVVSILLRKKMRNPTNVILAAIAISDSLTGISTLPTYLMVFLKYEPPISLDNITPEIFEKMGDYPIYGPPYNTHNILYNHYAGVVDNESDNDIPHHYGKSCDYLLSEGAPFPYGENNQVTYGGSSLSKSLCEWFMISKFFISKSFHSISIYLTVFLGVQRFISVAVPFRAQSLTTKRAVLICVLISVLSPFLHVYHLTAEKAVSGVCEWSFKKGCQGGCIEMWVMCFLRNILPCGTLLVFTVLFIRELHKGESSIRRMDSTRGQIARRIIENRRIAIIVTAIVIVFLIPEIPFGFYLLYNAIEQTTNGGKNIDLETNRAVHMSYELLLLLSFHANFYIYILFNRKFRLFLLKTFVQPVRKWMGDTRRISISSSRRDSNRRTEQMSLKSNSSTKIKNVQVLQDPPHKKPPAFLNSESVDITQTSHQNNLSKDNSVEV